ncbi:serine hydrolase domain-containing protein [Microbacterium oryzae]|uniref:serine hydrolase domain-containing protein n=1 Tax=Microbacterium oryzae TaxID=743009 RepID=UPI0025B04D45|nr:serine hydrolase domain-containing protein [Microbacterium oryzae]MDN3309854.1 serine hydrolase domain-containing protein [Microbacterium oryzae]
MTSAYAAAFDWARRHVDDGRLPTAVLGVATAHGIVALDAFGATDGRAARIEDRYRLFSITKTLAGLAAARAVERGQLGILTPLSVAVPEISDVRDDVVRLDHLVSHTAGIAEPPLDAPQGLPAALREGGRDFAAGSASRYSSVAFQGVAELVAHATGRSWEHDVAVFAPGITLGDESVPHDVVDAAAGGLDLSRFAALRHPGAGAIGSAADLLELGAALLRDGVAGTGGIVRPETLAMMRRPLTGAIPRLDPYPAERGQDWGFSWNLRTRAPGLIDRDVYGHAGWSGTEFWIHPTVGIAWVLLTNRASRQGVDPDELDNALVAGF